MNMAAQAERPGAGAARGAPVSAAVGDSEVVAASPAVVEPGHEHRGPVRAHRHRDCGSVVAAGPPLRAGGSAVRHRRAPVPVTNTVLPSGLTATEKLRTGCGGWPTAAC